METLTVTKKSGFDAAVSAPPSKSYSHRYLLSAALGKTPVRIQNVLFSKDILATLDCLSGLGAAVKKEARAVTVCGGGVPGTDVFDCGESGSTLRFLIPILAVLGVRAHITGRASLLRRPIDAYLSLFDQAGVSYRYTPGSGLTLTGRLCGGDYKMAGDVSSQYITGMLYALPLAQRDSTLTLTTPLLSRPYVDITLDVLKNSGITILHDQYQKFYIPGNQTYRLPDTQVEGDYSQAAVFAAAGVLGGRAVISGLRIHSKQGDAAVLDFFKAMGGQIAQADGVVTAQHASLTGGIFDVSNCPDIAPILALVCAAAKGKSVLTGTSRLRVKESDRVLSTLSTLKSLGAEAFADENTITILGGTHFLGCRAETFNDHRIAMMLCAAATVADGPVTLLDPKCVEKSYPTFYTDFAPFVSSMKGGTR